MAVNQPYPEEGKPIWEKLVEGYEPDIEQCQRGKHTWIAFFCQSGRLAFWKCEVCEKRDREIDQKHVRYEYFNGWIEFPLRLVARGTSPLASTRKWITAEGLVLSEGDPSSIHFVGLPIPEITDAHSYMLRESSGRIIDEFEPIREHPCQYNDHYWLTRFQVIDDELVRFRAHCFEESTLGTPFTHEPTQKVILSGLKLISRKHKQENEHD